MRIFSSSTCAQAMGDQLIQDVLLQMFCLKLMDDVVLFGRLDWVDVSLGKMEGSNSRSCSRGPNFRG